MGNDDPKFNHVNEWMRLGNPDLILRLLSAGVISSKESEFLEFQVGRFSFLSRKQAAWMQDIEIRAVAHLAKPKTYDDERKLPPADKPWVLSDDTPDWVRKAIDTLNPECRPFSLGTGFAVVKKDGV